MRNREEHRCLKQNQRRMDKELRALMLYYEQEHQTLSRELSSLRHSQRLLAPPTGGAMPQYFTSPYLTKTVREAAKNNVRLKPIDEPSQPVKTREEAKDPAESSVKLPPLSDESQSKAKEKKQEQKAKKKSKRKNQKAAQGSAESRVNSQYDEDTEPQAKKSQLQLAAEPSHEHESQLQLAVEPAHGHESQLQLAAEPSHGHKSQLQLAAEPAHGHESKLQLAAEQSNGLPSPILKLRKDSTASKVKTVHFSPDVKFVNREDKTGRMGRMDIRTADIKFPKIHSSGQLPAVVEKYMIQSIPVLPKIQVRSRDQDDLDTSAKVIYIQDLDLKAKRRRSRRSHELKEEVEIGDYPRIEDFMPKEVKRQREHPSQWERLLKKFAFKEEGEGTEEERDAWRMRHLADMVLAVKAHLKESEKRLGETEKREREEVGERLCQFITKGAQSPTKQVRCNT